jgi:hypothetical protein
VQLGQSVRGPARVGGNMQWCSGAGAIIGVGRAAHACSNGLQRANGPLLNRASTSEFIRVQWLQGGGAQLHVGEEV